MKKANVTSEQMTCIINIQMMQQKIGVQGHSFEYLADKSYDWLHDHQNGLIEHYNQAVKNAKLGH